MPKFCQKNLILKLFLQCSLNAMLCLVGGGGGGGGGAMPRTGQIF